MSVQAFHTYRQYKKLYSIQVVTETDIYKEDEVPDAEAGDAQLSVEVIHEVVLTDRSGQLFRMVFSIPEAKDKDGLVGGGYELNGASYVTRDYPSASGPSEVPTKLYIGTDNNLPPDNKISSAEMESLAGGWPDATTAP